MFIVPMKYCLFFAMLFCVLASCSKGPTYNGPKPNTPQSLLHDTLGPAIQIDSIPLAVGNTWQYLYTSDEQSYFYSVKVVADTIIKGERAAKVYTYTDSLLSIAYYSNRADGYYLLANRYLNPDSLVVLAKPNRILALPNVINNTWNTVDSTNVRYPEAFGWQWLDYDRITTVAGSFNCCRLSMDDGIPSYSYYSSKGLVKKLTFGVNGIQHVGGVYFIYSTTILTSVNF